jgi:hypothetical protein
VRREGHLRWVVIRWAGLGLYRNASMKRVLTSSFSLVVLACNPSPEEACEGYVTYRKKNDLPADDDVRTKCVTALEWVRDEAKGDAYQCASNGLKNAPQGEVAHIETTIMGCSSQYGENVDEARVRELWARGIADDFDLESGTVLTAKPDETARDWVRMFPQECEDVAIAAVRWKVEEGHITDPAEAEAFAETIRSGCLAVMETEASGTYRCIRLATSAAAVDKCLARR